MDQERKNMRAREEREARDNEKRSAIYCYMQCKSLILYGYAWTFHRAYVHMYALSIMLGKSLMNEMIQTVKRREKRRRIEERVRQRLQQKAGGDDPQPHILPYWFCHRRYNAGKWRFRVQRLGAHR